MSLKLRLRFMKRNAERGFTTVTLMGVLAVGGMLTAAGFAAVDPDISLSREDQDYKQSYGAAEAGLQWYLNRLGQDNSFYVRCANVPRPNATEYSPVNQPWNQAGSDPRIWRRLPGEEADYTVELLPAPGYPTLHRGQSVLDGRHRRQPPSARDRPVARRVSDRSGHAAPQELHRLHLLHAVRDARPGGLLGRRQRGHGHQPVLDLPRGAHQLLPGDPVRAHRRDQRTRCTPTTTCACAATRPSGATGATRSR